MLLELAAVASRTDVLDRILKLWPVEMLGNGEFCAGFTRVPKCLMKPLNNVFLKLLGWNDDSAFLTDEFILVAAMAKGFLAKAFPARHILS